MSRLFPSTPRWLGSLFEFLLDAMGDGLRFLRLSLRSRSALRAEILFLRKQLAFYEERQTEPRRLTGASPKVAQQRSS